MKKTHCFNLFGSDEHLNTNMEVVVVIKLIAMHIERGLYLSLWFMHSFVQKLYWIINGTAKQCNMIRSREYYSMSAHVQNIWLRHTVHQSSSAMMGSADFITTHSSFEHPGYVLQDHITLYDITRTQAIFVETSPDVDVTDMSVNCFMRLAQHKAAKRVIVMPMWALHILAREVGEPTPTLVFLSNTSRCGSTLICQIFQSTGACVNYNEPACTNTLSGFSSTLPDNEFNTIATSVVRAMARERSKNATLACLFKLSGPGISQIDKIARLFPRSKHLFMYRDCLPNCKSLYKLSLANPIIYLALYMATFSTRILSVIMAQMGLDSRDFNFNFKGCSPLVSCVMVWSAICAKYLQLRKQGMNISAIKYEHIHNNPEHFLKVLFEYCELPEYLIKPALSSFDRDSQQNSNVSRPSLRIKNCPSFNHAIMADIAALSDKFGVSAAENFILPGTITKPNYP